MFDEAQYISWSRDLDACRVYNPRAFLGRHQADDNTDVVRFYLPGAVRVDVLDQNAADTSRPVDYAKDGIYAVLVRRDQPTPQVQVHWGGGVKEVVQDPYSQPLVVGELDMHLFSQGRHMRLFEVMGCTWHDGLARFVVWAPSAQAVSVIGDMNAWDPRRHAMENRGQSGLWEITLPAAKPGQSYKFHLSVADGGDPFVKADPFAYQAEMRPKTASVVPAEDFLAYKASDNQRRLGHDKPVSIYEVHLGSWRKHDGWRFYSYQDLAQELVDYASWMGFTHIELLPLHEHPFDGSWGYQPTGLYAATSRFGPPEGLKALVQAAHAKGLGVILDWVPAHFPKDTHALAKFDGTALFEHPDPQKGEHQDWGTLIYNFGRPEVRAFLISNAAFWIEVFGIDGLRVDAVASMLYLDYSREPGEWEPNEFGGRENLDAIRFLRELNQMIYQAYPHAAMIAEESTAWPGVSRPLAEGYVENQPARGPLGFGYKWNMGWMNDTLRYLSTKPVHRKFDHRLITFGLDYVYDENFILPLSHDEVVHGKGSLLKRAAEASEGDNWQRFANLRAYLGFMYGHPGKKLLFMGQELAAPFEWSADDPLDWSLEDSPLHQQMQAFVRSLNHVYASTPALYQGDCKDGGFSWVQGGDADQSVLAFLRWSADRRQVVLIASNFTPVPRAYSFAVPFEGAWQIISDSDDAQFGGSQYRQSLDFVANFADPADDQPKLHVDLPPLATIMIAPQL